MESRKQTVEDPCDEVACEYHGEGFQDDKDVNESDLDENNRNRIINRCIAMKNRLQQHRQQFSYLIYSILIASYAAYLLYSCYYNFYNALPLVVCTGITLLYLLYVFVRDRMGECIHEKCLSPIGQLVDKHWRILKWLICIIVFGGLLTFLILDMRHSARQFISAVGFLVIILLCFLFSKNHRKVRWRPVLWGAFLQFLLGLFILRTSAGFALFRWLGEVIAYFFSFANYGSKFVFGEKYEYHYFAFKLLPVIIYFSCVINILHYLGAIRFCIGKLAWILHKTMRTSAVESFAAAGNIFIGQTETLFFIRPFLDTMTISELHAVITGGFATMSGDAPGVYASIGIDPMHIITASVMSAPAALGISKLLYPEEESSKYITSKDVDENISKDKERNILEAASNGASVAATSVAMIAANLIAFISLLEFVNAALAWFGSMVGLHELTFQLICSYVFMPVAFLIGVEWDDCQLVGELMGLKFFINEFVAYVRLAEIMENSKIGQQPTISARSSVISIYILCGFDNIGSMGVMLSCLASLIPNRKTEVAKIIKRALLAGSLTCLSTACIAGLLYKEMDG